VTDPTSPSAESPLDLWASSTWEGHARWQLARTLSATPLERLLWLEEAIELAWESGALRGRVGTTSGRVETNDAAGSD